VRRSLSALIVTASLAATGCGVSASVTAGPVGNVAAYRAAWQREWDVVGREEIPYAPTASSPGVCNKGGVKTECYETDRRVGVSVRHLAATLREVKVPAEYRTATALTLEALSEWVLGLKLRMAALEAGHTEAEREEWWRQSKIAMVESVKLLARASAAFPASSRPLPQPDTLSELPSDHAS
jgi:hypothetical protein